MAIFLIIELINLKEDIDTLMNLKLLSYMALGKCHIGKKWPKLIVDWEGLVIILIEITMGLLREFKELENKLLKSIKTETIELFLEVAFLLNITQMKLIKSQQGKHIITMIIILEKSIFLKLLKSSKKMIKSHHTNKSQSFLLILSKKKSLSSIIWKTGK